MSEKKYININRADGIGSQLYLFVNFINNTDEFDFIVDLRNWSYFRQTKEIDFNRIFSLFNFHKRVIVDPIKIDKIKKEYITDAVRTNKSYLDYKLTLGHKVNMNGPYTSENLLMTLKKEPIVDFDIKQCVGVHGRFGNGERCPQLENRMVSKNLFIEKMKRHNNKCFFVCSDSESFVNFCKDEFGEKIKVQDRTFLPNGCGPGHVPRLYKKNDFEVDPITMLYESYVDMYLLSKCSHLICNFSMFNVLARKKIGLKNIEFLK
jgi:hypothetical protein